jgi:NADPH:quinone reductase-like Zn-dependent oxidoreductase
MYARKGCSTTAIVHPGVFPLEEAAKAHEVGERGRTTGKIVLTVA